ncbi:hypothetical protein [Flavivirga spongiicola]|uniref:Uncharacterized protein n=1 Tax=Flavivirga spongiicola TaxID=421621 RepID=A0ABU7XPV3_9FLAO|nr:hypothetical protein [Flavivirga sp. MEBiC05379]MDO5977796.1 hypothetical protein [Flavivirga sp. MEBiC05379]
MIKASWGIYSKEYLALLLNFAPNDKPDEKARRDFIKKRLNSGSVIEIGLGYQHLKTDFFGLISIQFQRFSISGTANELITNLDLEGQFSDLLLLENLIKNSILLRPFYNEKILHPIIDLTQLQFALGKTFRFESLPRISISALFSYNFNIANSVNIESNSFIGQTIIDLFVNPTLEKSSDLNFGSLNYPSLTLQLNYSFW